MGKLSYKGIIEIVYLKVAKFLCNDFWLFRFFNFLENFVLLKDFYFHNSFLMIPLNFLPIFYDCNSVSFSFDFPSLFY